MINDKYREEEVSEEILEIIEEAIKIRGLQQRWLTPAQLRKAAEAWVNRRNRISESSRRLREESGISVSSKWEYVVPDHLKEPLYSAVLKVMVERGEWETEPGTDIPQYKRTPTIKYTFKLAGGRGDLTAESKP